MRKFLSLLILCTSASWAGGPKYSHQPPKLDDEINNIYHDLSHIRNSSINTSSITARWANITSGTVSGSFSVPTLTVSSITFTQAMYVSSASVLTNIPAGGTTADAVSVTLPAGTWSISLLGYLLRNSATPSGAELIFVGTAAGNSTTGLIDGTNAAYDNMTATQNNLTLAIPQYIVSPTVPTIYYFKINGGASSGTLQIMGTLTAIRIF